MKDLTPGRRSSIPCRMHHFLTNMELKEMEGVHEFLRQYMKLQKEFLDEFNREEGGVYFYRYTIRELPNKSWPWEYITIEKF